MNSFMNTLHQKGSGSYCLNLSKFQFQYYKTIWWQDKSKGLHFRVNYWKGHAIVLVFGFIGFQFHFGDSSKDWLGRYAWERKGASND